MFDSRKAEKPGGYACM